MNINEELKANEEGFNTAMDCLDDIADKLGLLFIPSALRNIARVLREENPYTKARIDLGFTNEEEK